MRHTRSIAVAVVGATVLSGSFLLSQALADAPVKSQPASASSTTQVPIDALVARAADVAGLEQMCLDGQHDAGAQARFQAAAAAHPVVAAQIGRDCSPVIVNP